MTRYLKLLYNYYTSQGQESKESDCQTQADKLTEAKQTVKEGDDEEEEEFNLNGDELLAHARAGTTRDGLETTGNSICIKQCTFFS